MKSALAICALGAAAVASALDFQGTGQIRTLHETNHSDIGCLTSEGKWTLDESLCDVFTSERKDNVTIHITNSAGTPLGLDNSAVAVGDDRNTTWMLFYGGIEVIPGRDILGWSQYGLMASVGDVPTSPSDPPITIRFWASLDKQPYVWLGWKAA